MNLTRRTVLAAGALTVPVLAAACTPPKRATPQPSINPDDTLRAAALVREHALIAAYRDALVAVPALERTLGPLLADHQAHLLALGENPAPPGASAASATPGATSSPAPTTKAVTPRTAAAAVARLRALEHTAAAAHADAAFTASRRLAATLASLAACEASHGVAL